MRVHWSYTVWRRRAYQRRNLGITSGGAAGSAASRLPGPRARATPSSAAWAVASPSEGCGRARATATPRRAQGNGAEVLLFQGPAGLGPTGPGTASGRRAGPPCRRALCTGGGAAVAAPRSFRQRAGGAAGACLARRGAGAAAPRARGRHARHCTEHRPHQKLLGRPGRLVVERGSHRRPKG